MQKTPYTVINASAGSGKTHTLVQRILLLCLASPSLYDNIKNILALTFTNKAANEMKERILSWLKEFSQKDYEKNDKLEGIQKILKDNGINLTMQDLHERSQKTLDFILHNYSSLNIGTIDKFNSKLIRSFSNELGLPHNFNLEIQAEPYLIEAVDKILDQIGDDEKISETFMDYVNYSLDNDDKIRINESLYKSAKDFFSDVHYEEIKKNEKFDWNAYKLTKEKIRTEIAELEKESKKIAETTLDLLKEKNLQSDDFASAQGGTLGKFFDSYLKFTKKENDFPFPKDEETAQNSYQKGSSSKSKNRQGEILEILDYLILQRNTIVQNQIKIINKQKILEALLPLKINKEIHDQLESIEQENDLLLLSKFNILIHENLKNEPSEFIYEKIGTRFQHYFLDEFQDTSKMQWENIIPLKNHIVSSEGNTFTLVGDPKQSIYRFRGGDSELMLNILNNVEKSIVPANPETLKHNWRSAKNIVEFNNELYNYTATAEDLNENHKNLFAPKEDDKQLAKKDFLGRVKVNLLENDGKDNFFHDAAEKMAIDIQECVDNGFKFSDITILCRTADEIRMFSQILRSEEVSYKGEETYIKTISEKGITLEMSTTLQALIEFLKWEENPRNLQFLVRMLYHLNFSGRIKMQEFSEETAEILERNKNETYKDFIARQKNLIKEKYGVKLNNEGTLHLNLYNFIENYLKEFALENFETEFLLNFLELVYNFSQNSGATLKDFLKFWDEEASKTAVQSSDNVDAVKLMTIHSAKGLEFPVVFLPMKNQADRKSFNEWFQLEGYDELKSVNIKEFTKVVANYDEDAENFNVENNYKKKIDKLCVQYVATTRPVEQLFLYLQKRNKTSNHLTILDFVESKNSVEDSFDLYPEVENSYKKQPEKEQEKRNIKNISVKSDEENKPFSIKIATPSKSYQNRNEKVRTGIFTHEILAKINSEKDVEKVLENYFLEGFITETERKNIAETILKIINENKKYFAENQEIINEKDIMISGENSSKIYRPDRLVKTSEGWYIIDFKTGDEKEKHQKQIENYKVILENLGYKVAGSELIYV